MKKLLSILLVIMLVVICGACSSDSNNTTVEEKEETPQIEYYSNSQVPTLESISGENLIEPRDGYYLYGPYDTEEEGEAVMQLYVATLVEVYKFQRIDSSMGFELTRGTDTVKIFGGNKGDKLAVCVMIN